MNPDVRRLADQAAEKIRGGYNVPHAINSALKEWPGPTEEKEALRREIAQELNRRSQLRRKKSQTASRYAKRGTRNPQDASRQAKHGARKMADKEAAQRAEVALEKIMKRERSREARHMAFQRRDHLLPDP